MTALRPASRPDPRGCARARPRPRRPGVRALRGRRSCRPRTWRTRARSSSVACAAIRRSRVVAGDAPRLEPVEAHLASAPPPRSPPRTPRSCPDRASARSGTSQTTTASAGASSIRCENSSHDRRPGDRLEGQAALVVGERDPREAGPVEATVACGGCPAPKRSTSAASAGCPGSTTARATCVGVDDRGALVLQQVGDGRLPGPDPPRQPHQQHRSTIAMV